MTRSTENAQAKARRGRRPDPGLKDMQVELLIEIAEGMIRSTENAPAGAAPTNRPRNARPGRGRATATLDMIAAIVEIAREIQPCGVRALAYQLFVRKLIASMSDAKKVSRWSTIAREEGTLPWEWITDSTREEQCVSTWDNPEEYARAVQHSYRRNKWAEQPTHVAVWSEKGTIEGALRPVLDKYEVPFQIAHGFCSATTMHDMAEASQYRLQDTLIIYVGDYDPSGMWMSEMDLPKRLARYSTDNPSNKDLGPEGVRDILAKARIRIRRVALTEADTRALGRGLGFPAEDKKGDDDTKGDARYPWFVRNYGDWCWELDALSPTTLRDRVEAAIVANLDRELWDRYVRVELEEKALIVQTCQAWKSILRQDQE